MSLASRRNQKNLYAKPDVIGRDVVDLGAASADAVAGTTSLTDRNGLAQYVAGADMRLEGAHLSVSSGVLNLGHIGVALALDGAPVASGSLVTGQGGKYLSLQKGELQDVAVASGQILTATYDVTQSLDTTRSIRCALSLAILQRSER
jgi:hypothetical protein